MNSSGVGKPLLADMPRRDVEKINRTRGQPEFTQKTLISSEELFSDLYATRKRSWSIDNDERCSGMCCVTSNIYHSFGEAIAGISATGPTKRFPKHVISELGPKVKQAADEVTNKIGGKPPRK